MTGVITLKIYITMEQKTKLMRFSHIGISIIFLLLLYSCRKVDYMEKGTFIYLNKSGHTIVMTFFEKNSFLLNHTIANNDSLMIFQEGDGAIEPFIFDNKGKTDSIVILYKQPDKQEIYLYRDGIFSENSYKITKIKDHDFRYSFIFSETDYTNAEEIN